MKKTVKTVEAVTPVKEEDRYLRWGWFFIGGVIGLVILYFMYR